MSGCDKNNNIYTTNNNIFDINTLNYNKNNNFIPQIILFFILIRSIIIQIIIFISQTILFLVLILSIIIKIIIFITQLTIILFLIFIR